MDVDTVGVDGEWICHAPPRQRLSGPKPDPTRAAGDNSSNGSQRDVFAAALEAHEAWNANLREAIKTGDCPTPVEQARRDDSCTFGKWLHADESFKAAQPDRWQNLHDLHERFHRHAAQVLECALSGRKEEAERLANAPEFAEIKPNLSRALTLTTA